MLGILAEGLDSCLIILLRVKEPVLWQARARKEYTHEARSQDFDPAVRTSGHVCSSRRSAGSRPGRRPHSNVPTTTTTARQMQPRYWPAADGEIAVKRISEVAAR